jgi:hypothetical protein
VEAEWGRMPARSKRRREQNPCTDGPHLFPNEIQPGPCVRWKSPVNGGGAAAEMSSNLLRKWQIGPY